MDPNVRLDAYNEKNITKTFRSLLADDMVLTIFAIFASERRREATKHDDIWNLQRTIKSLIFI